MQLSQMRTLLRAQIGNPTAVDVPENKLTEKLNLSYHDISGRYRFHKARKRCTFYTVLGQRLYSLPTDCEVVLRLWDTTNRKKLEKIGDRQLSSQTSLETTYAKPEKYLRYRDLIELLPIPDLGTEGEQDGYAIEIFYKYFVMDLVDDADVPGIPASWHFGIVMFAEWMYYHTDAKDIPKAQAAYEAWKLWVADKPTEIDEEGVDIDSGVEVLSLSQNITPRQDFNHAD